MGRATGGSAASAQDVRLQQQGQPTQAEAAQNGTLAAAVGEDKLQKVAADLDRARSLDGKNDSGCMGAVNDARQSMTPRRICLPIEAPLGVVPLAEAASEWRLASITWMTRRRSSDCRVSLARRGRPGRGPVCNGLAHPPGGQGPFSSRNGRSPLERAFEATNYATVGAVKGRNGRRIGCPASRVSTLLARGCGHAELRFCSPEQVDRWL